MTATLAETEHTETDVTPTWPEIVHAIANHAGIDALPHLVIGVNPDSMPLLLPIAGPDAGRWVDSLTQVTVDENRRSGVVAYTGYIIGGLSVTVHWQAAPRTQLLATTTSLEEAVEAFEFAWPSMIHRHRVETIREYLERGVRRDLLPALGCDWCGGVLDVTSCCLLGHCWNPACLCDGCLVDAKADAR